MCSNLISFSLSPKCCATCGASTCPRSVIVNARMGWPSDNNYVKVQGQVQIFAGLAKAALFVEATAAFARFYQKTILFNAYSVEVFLSANWNIFTRFKTSQVSFYVNLEAMRNKIIAGARNFTQGIIYVLKSRLKNAEKDVETTEKGFAAASAALNKVKSNLDDAQASNLNSLRSAWVYANRRRKTCGECSGFDCVGVPAKCSYWASAEATTWTAYNSAKIAAIPADAVVNTGLSAAQSTLTIAKMVASAAVQVLTSLQTKLNKIPVQQKSIQISPILYLSLTNAYHFLLGVVRWCNC